MECPRTSNPIYTSSKTSKLKSKHSPMKTPIFVLLLLCFLGKEVQAQGEWSAKDSLWLKDLLLNKKKIKLNPEVMKSIKSGEFINFDSKHTDSQLKTDPISLPLMKDFTPYILKDYKKADPKKMLPSVFKLYTNSDLQITNLRSFSMEGIDNYQPDLSRPSLSTNPFFTKSVPNGGASIMVNLNQLIDYYFVSKKRK